MTTDRRRPLVGVSLKMYFSPSASLDWLRDVAGRVSRSDLLDRVDLFVAPGFLELWVAADLLRGTGIRVCAQDVAPTSIGAMTGEVSAAGLAEVGCSLVEIGHAERRRHFAETDATVSEKTRLSHAAGLTPLVCIGEPVRDGGSDQGAAAVAACLPQMEAAWSASGATQRVVFAYEPVWAIGQEFPAEPSYIAEVLQQLRREAILAGRPADAFIYGGSADFGLFPEIKNSADGLFLGRRAHDPDNFMRIVAEVSSASPAHA